MTTQNIDVTTFRGSNDGTIIPSQLHYDKLEDDQVLIKITHSGVCFTDMHYRHSGQVLGHEGVGIIQEVGPHAPYLKQGDRVGFGYMHSTCGHCHKCLSGAETYCAERQWYGTHDFSVGSFASHAVWKESFVFKIPDAVPSEYAAPLQCAGATVFNVLAAYDARPTERIGVIGVGGLGHLAIQFAAKMGAEVVVFSGSDSKRDEAFALGASEFHATKGATKLDVTPIDRLIVTTNTLPGWDLYVPILGYEATIHNLTISQDDFIFPSLPLTINGLRIQGSVVASRAIHTQMLEFAARHRIKPMIETFPLTKEGIEQAFERLGSGKVRYRAVLVAQN